MISAAASKMREMTRPGDTQSEVVRRPFAFPELATLDSPPIPQRVVEQMSPPPSSMSTYMRPRSKQTVDIKMGREDLQTLLA